MNRFSKILRYSLLVFLMTVLFLPLIQSNFGLFTLKPLQGDITLPAKVEFKPEDWMTAKYQEEQENYLTQMFGFRSTCIRINNQIAYQFFNYAKANGVIIGKEDCLFEIGYIDAYTGKDFVGQDSINHILARLKYLNEVLKQNNKHLLIVLTPGKSNYFPEYIPDKYLKDMGGTRNYTALLSGIKAEGLNLIDFNAWFLENKHKGKNPWFIKYGIHWTPYGAVRSADSIIKKVEAITAIDMPDFTYDASRMAEAGDKEYDIAEGMNLFIDFPRLELSSPLLYVSNTDKQKPSILIISDSFFWGIYSTEFANCFKEHHFWYYNKTVFPDEGKNLVTDGLNTRDEILKHDVVMLMITEANLKKFGWGFLENAERDFKGAPNKPALPPYDVLKKRWTKYIKGDPKWMEGIRKVAKERGISADSVVSLEADWQIQHL